MMIQALILQFCELTKLILFNQSLSVVSTPMTEP